MPVNFSKMVKSDMGNTILHDESMRSSCTNIVVPDLTGDGIPDFLSVIPAEDGYENACQDGMIEPAVKLVLYKGAFSGNSLLKTDDATVLYTTDKTSPHTRLVISPVQDYNHDGILDIAFRIYQYSTVSFRGHDVSAIAKTTEVILMSERVFSDIRRPR